MSSLRILLADDHTVVRQGLRKVLEECPDWEVVAEAGDGREAVRQAEALTPDVAIVDQWMPEMTGAELVRALRSSGDARVRSIAIIGLSGRPGSERELLAAGALTFLPKPFRLAQLTAALRLARLALEPVVPATSSAA